MLQLDAMDAAYQALVVHTATMPPLQAMAKAVQVHTLSVLYANLLRFFLNRYFFSN